jgi:hypothetical protein
MTVRQKKRICTVLGFMLLVLVLGFVGGMELGTLPIGKGAFLALGCELVGAFLLYKAGVVRVR